MRMESRERSSFSPYFSAFLFQVLVGWGGVAGLVFLSVPAVWQRWSFFLFLTMGLTGVGLPIAYYLNLRFPSNPPVDPGILMRQSLWLGIFGSTLAWLQLGGLVTIWTVLVLGAGLFGIEYFLRLREGARWRPPRIKEEPPSQLVG